MWKGSRLTKAPAKKKASVTRKSVRARSKLSNSKIVDKRKKVFALKSAIVFVVVTSFFGGVSWLSFSNFLGVGEVIVEGNKEVSTTAIQARITASTVVPVLGLFSRQNTLSYPKEELKEILVFEFPKIELVEIDVKPTKHSVIVSIVERTDYARWCNELGEQKMCYRVDPTGFVFENESAISNDKVTFFGGIEDSSRAPLRLFIAPKYFVEVTQLLEDLKKINLHVNTFTFEGEDARIIFSEGWELRVALDKNIDATVTNLEAILSENSLRERLNELLYIDMRFDERIYYKLIE